MKNLKFALRILLKTPSVTLIAVLSLGLGIGTTTAIFSMYDQLVRRQLNVQEPGRLVNFSSPGLKRGSSSGGAAGGLDALFSYPMFRDLEKIQGVFTGVAAHRSFDAALAYQGQTPLPRMGLYVSGSYFPVLGLQPAIGRLLGPADDTATGESRVAVLAHSFWRTNFDANPAVLGKTLLVNGQALTIVGVAPEGFTGTALGEFPVVFIPIKLKEVIPPHEKTIDRFWYWVYVFARLQPGVSMEEAGIAANAAYRSIINNVEAPLQLGFSDRQMSEFRANQLVLESGDRGQSMFLNEENSAALLLMMLMAGMVLLIACANISNLLLARAAARTTEMAIRQSLGASRANLVTQLLTESLVLAVLGGAAGLLFARWTVDAALWAIFSESWLGEAMTSALNPAVLVFAATVTLGATVAFGLFPAIQSARPGMLTASAGSTSRTSGTRLATRFRWTLATAQIAISTALLVAAGLFTRSLFNVNKIDVGFNPKALVAFSMAPNISGYSSQQSRALFERLEAELAAQPGVTEVTAALVPVLAGVRGTAVSVQGYPNGPEADSGTGYNLIGPGYFHAMGIPLISGREFTASDTMGASAVIVNEQFAKKFNLGANPVGKGIAWGAGEKTFPMPIVGLVPDVKYSGLKGEVPPMFFYPYRQNGWVGNLTFYVRGTLPENTLLAMIPGVVAKVAPNLPIDNLRTMAQTIRDNTFDDRVFVVMTASFAILATILAAGGLYGVMAYTVAQRTREFGVRMALGAAPSAIRVMVLRQVAVMTLVGGGVGVAASIGFGRVIESGLFQMKGYDSTVLLVSTVLLGIVAIAAGFLPAHRASKVEPMRALRYE